MMRKLFIIPYAGGSSMSFVEWKEYSSKKYEIIPLDIPGKGKRMTEPLLEKFQDAVWDIYSQIERYISEGTDDYSILGHSMGSYISYEVCKLIIKNNLLRPKHLILSGTVAPHKFHDDEMIEVIKGGDEKLVEYLVESGEIPEKILRSSLVKRSFLPIIKNDYTLLLEYYYTYKIEILDLNVIVINGKEDDLEPESIYGWTECFVKPPVFSFFSGNHFYIVDNMHDVLPYLETLE